MKSTTHNRTVSVHEHESTLQHAKAFQRTEEFRTLYRKRVCVEHRIARLVQLGVRKARYFGNAKVLCQLAMTATVANLALIAATSARTPTFFFVTIFAALCTLLHEVAEQILVRWLFPSQLVQAVLIQNSACSQKRGLRLDF